MKHIFLCAAVAACLVALAAKFGVTKALGAHPFWDFEVALYGAIPGVVLSLVLSMIPRWGLLCAAADLVLAGAVTWWGKRVFVASFGDDAFAGQLWFFGWIAVCACSIAVFALVIHKFIARPVRKRTN